MSIIGVRRVLHLASHCRGLAHTQRAYRAICEMLKKTGCPDHYCRAKINKRAVPCAVRAAFKVITDAVYPENALAHLLTLPEKCLNVQFRAAMSLLSDRKIKRTNVDEH